MWAARRKGLSARRGPTRPSGSLCSEPPSNPGMSVTRVSEVIAAEVVSFHYQAMPVWVEHYPPEATDGRSETFSLGGALLFVVLLSAIVVALAGTVRPPSNGS